MRQELNDSDEIVLIRKKCADSIFEFGRMFETMRELYEDFGLYYPKECNTNYRDSWFHFRKLYSKRDKLSVLNEKYGLEEHLLRAAKDAQIFLLQQLGEWLEIWSDYRTYLDRNHSGDSDYQDMLKKIPLDTRNWVSCLWNICEEDRILFSNACLYRFEKEIYNKSLQKKLQELLCSIKNLILDLRLGGVNIYRPADNTYYLAQCVDICDSIAASLQGTGMLYLISSTELIWDTCRIKASKQSSVP